MDKDFMIGCLCALLGVVTVVAGLTFNSYYSYASRVDFERICVANHKSVIYTEVDDSLVSECK
jgi:hypothetical protein